MEVRLILFKEISFGISLSNPRNPIVHQAVAGLGRKNQENDSSFLK
jgi:hypothetical protein